MNTEKPYGEVLDEMDHQAKYQSATEPTPEKIAYRNALFWAFDRLSVTGGMTAQEQRYTMQQIGNVLTGRASCAATYEPHEWDASAQLIESRR